MKHYDSLDSWRAEAVRRFGDDEMKWRFVCPSCQSVMSVEDYKSAKAPQGAVAFSCVGRWSGAAKAAFDRRGDGPCDYAGGGLIGLNPVTIEGRDTRVFDFAEQ